MSEEPSADRNGPLSDKRERIELSNRRSVWGKTLFVFIVISAVYVFSQVMDAVGVDPTLMRFIIFCVFFILVVLNAGKQL